VVKASDSPSLDRYPPAMAPTVVVPSVPRPLVRARDLCAFVDASPTPYHAVAECARRLVDAGYVDLAESEPWRLTPGQGYFVTRNASTILAFRLAARPPSETGFAMVGAHVDSPNLRVKPRPETGAEGYRQLGVEVYGGAILATWTDRDLGLAGRVVLAGPGVGPRGGTRQRLFAFRRPLARVANLAIHLNRGVNEEGLKLDKQRHLQPILGLDPAPGDREGQFAAFLARELGEAPEDVLGFDVSLFDVVPATLGGLSEEFVFAARLDNLGSSYAALTALVEASRRGSDAESSWLIALFDHEECGSQSLQGAQGTFVRDVLARLATCHPAAGPRVEEEVGRALARSLLVSADMAHAVHPNYAEYHEPSHKPRLNRGPAIKRNENQRYATDAESAALFASLCRDAGFEPQHFVSRTDLPCGTTIGPISAAGVGVKTVDVGNPMLSMHSIRECCGRDDQDLLVEALLRLFR
jgi:aspartyl aminopeptidase